MVAAAEALNNRHKKETKKKTRKKPIMGKTRARVVSHVAEVTKKKRQCGVKKGRGRGGQAKQELSNSQRLGSWFTLYESGGGRQEREGKEKGSQNIIAALLCVLATVACPLVTVVCSFRLSFYY